MTVSCRGLKVEARVMGQAKAVTVAIFYSKCVCGIPHGGLGSVQAPRSLAGSGEEGEGRIAIGMEEERSKG